MQYYVIRQPDSHVDVAHSQEDHFSLSTEHSIFVVADGVTLNFKKLAEGNIKYPNPSPASEVAKIFCQATVRSAVDKCSEFTVSQIVEVFKEANSKVKKYNQKMGKSDISGNITGFYAATGAFLIIKEMRAYWATICDSFVAHFDTGLNLRFMSSGLCKPYAVINGEERMAEYLEKGVFDLERGDAVFLFTDGFENYFSLSEFAKIFIDWSTDLDSRVKKITAEKSAADPDKFGRERTLIAVKV